MNELIYIEGKTNEFNIQFNKGFQIIKNLKLLFKKVLIL